MANPTRGQARDKAFYVKANANINYGFKTKEENATGISDADLTTQLGWTAFSPSTGGSITLVVFGADLPKPPRVTKRLADNRSFSGFCAFDKLRDALNLHGWTFSKQGRPLAAGGGAVKRLVAVPLTNPSGNEGTTLYGFLMRRDDITAYPTLIQQLGVDLTLGEGAIKRMVIGTKRPRPGRAATDVTVNGRTGTFSSFYDPSKEDTLFAVDAEGTAKWRQVKAAINF